MLYSATRRQSQNRGDGFICHRKREAYLYCRLRLPKAEEARKLHKIAVYYSANLLLCLISFPKNTRAQGTSVNASAIPPRQLPAGP